jgi:hypothetical protein
MRAVGYAAAHRHHRKALAGGRCPHCTLEVALKHDVPVERLLIGTGRHQGLLYSILSSDYELRCRHDHRLSDSRQRRITKEKSI